tara:strand:+ start:976 stop:1599 length:624 start_codon:yes stop_codon:yes gene_type:complete
MKNHYKILGVDKNIRSKDLKIVYKDLFKMIDKANTTEEKKIELKKKVYESYHFLADYHSRKSLDEYLNNDSKNQSGTLIKKDNNDSIYQKNNLIMPFQSPLTNILPTLFDKSFMDSLEVSGKNNTPNAKDKNSKFFMKSVTSKIVPDKNGNMVQEVVETTNNNGKKDEKRYKKNLGDIYQNKSNNKGNYKVIYDQPKKNSKNNGFFF